MVLPPGGVPGVSYVPQCGDRLWAQHRPQCSFNIPLVPQVCRFFRYLREVGWSDSRRYGEAPPGLGKEGQEFFRSDLPQLVNASPEAGCPTLGRQKDCPLGESFP